MSERYRPERYQDLVIPIILLKNLNRVTAERLSKWLPVCQSIMLENVCSMPSMKIVFMCLPILSLLLLRQIGSKYGCWQVISVMSALLLLQALRPSSIRRMF